MTHKLKYITRFAYPGSGRPHWWVRFVRHGVIVVNERFYDSDFGGARRSLVAAKEFRDRILEWEPLLLPRGYRHQPHRSRRGIHYSEYWQVTGCAGIGSRDGRTTAGDASGVSRSPQVAPFTWPGRSRRSGVN
jgi:hypothetical protein